MLASYYEKEENSDDLFGGLRISRAITYRDHLNQYDVIKINMQEFLSVTNSVDEIDVYKRQMEYCVKMLKQSNCWKVYIKIRKYM